MNKQGPYVVGVCLLCLCFGLWSGEVPEPGRCLVSGFYNLVQLPERNDETCWTKCFAKPGCHMAVVTRPLNGSSQCLLVNCLNEGNYSLPRDPSTQIIIYPKSTLDEERRDLLMKGVHGSADERLRCFEFMFNSSCLSGLPRFFYNSTSYRCESFSTGCRSNRNTFETQEECEALCDEKFRCYRPSQSGGCHAHSSRFFYNVTSQRCETFVFSGCGSNGNMFATADECENLCGDVKVSASNQTAVYTVHLPKEPAVDTGILYYVILVILLVVIFINSQNWR